MAFDIEALRREHDVLSVAASRGVTLVEGANRCPLPGHEDSNPSFSVYDQGRRFKCHGCAAGGDVFTFAALMAGLSPEHDFKQVCEMLDGGAPAAEAVETRQAAQKRAQFKKALPANAKAVHDYMDAGGRIVFHTVRTGRAKGLPYTPVDGGYVVEQRIDQDRPLYGLLALLGAPPDHQVWIVEGEKCVDVARKAFPKRVVVTSSGGTNAWRKTDWSPLYGRKVLLVADEDDPGRKMMCDLAAHMEPHGCEIKVALPTGGPKGHDIADVIDAGGEKAALSYLKGASRPWSAVKADLGDDAPPPADGPEGGGDNPFVVPFTSGGLLRIHGEFGVTDLRCNVRGIPRLQGRGWEFGDAFTDLTDRHLMRMREQIIDKGYQRPAARGTRIWDIAANRLVSMLENLAPEVDPFVMWLDSLEPWDPDNEASLLWHWLPELIEGPEARGGPGTVAGYVSYILPVAAVARTYRPGIKFDLMPVLIGRQGLGKSTAVKLLLPEDEGWVKEGLDLSADARRKVESMDGAVIVECAELSGVRKADIESLKSFITETEWRGRLAYGRASATVKRRSILVGTSNDDSALPNDPTGNRRFVPVTFRRDADGPGADAMHHKGMKRWMRSRRERIWAEALYVWRAGEAVLYPPGNVGGELNDMVLAATDRDEVVENALERMGLLYPPGKTLEQVMKTISEDVDPGLQESRPDYWNSPFAKRVQAGLRKRGTRSHQRRIRGGARQSLWVDDVADPHPELALDPKADAEGGY